MNSHTPSYRGYRFLHVDDDGAPIHGQHPTRLRLSPQPVRGSQKILTLQGDGDYEGTSQLVEDMARIGPQLESDLERLNRAGIPVDIVFEQGIHVLGL